MPVPSESQLTLFSLWKKAIEQINNNRSQFLLVGAAVIVLPQLASGLIIGLSSISKVDELFTLSNHGLSNSQIPATEWGLRFSETAYSFFKISILAWIVASLTIAVGWLKLTDYSLKLRNSLHRLHSNGEIIKLSARIVLIAFLLFLVQAILPTQLAFILAALIGAVPAILLAENLPLRKSLASAIFMRYANLRAMPKFGVFLTILSTSASIFLAEELLQLFASFLSESNGALSQFFWNKLPQGSEGTLQLAILSIKSVITGAVMILAIPLYANLYLDLKGDLRNIE